MTACTVTKAKVVKRNIFTPTRGKAWTKKAVSLNIIQKTTYNTLIFPALKLFIKPKLKPEIWTRVETLDLTTLQTVGDIEKFALSILKDTDLTSDPKRATEIHDKLKNALQLYAEEGLLKAASAFRHLADEE